MPEEGSSAIPLSPCVFGAPGPVATPSGSKQRARQAADLCVDLCENDASEYLGVVSFSNTAVSDFPIQNVTAAANTKNNAIAAICGIAVENMTALGDGLRRSLNEITGGSAVAPSDAAVEAIVLLSDGVHNFGTESPAAMLSSLRRIRRISC